VTDASGPLSERVLDAIKRGNHVEAIKLLREQTGLGLKEAKDLVDRQVAGTSTTTPAQWSGTLPPSAMIALQQGNEIEAIRLLRAETGLGLKEAREGVEAVAREMRDAGRLRSPGEVPRSRAGFFWLAAAVIVGVIVYLALRHAA
jgi:ribosomal protein L7/L12